jgi:large conductance mechanosensitive channel
MDAPDSEDEMLKGFKEFILRGNVVDLAIAVVIGTAFAAVVSTFVSSIVTPLVNAAGGNNTNGLGFSLKHTAGAPHGSAADVLGKSAVVNKLVTDLITPLIAAIGGKPNFGELSFTLHKSKFLYGDFINAVLSFLIIAAAIYFTVVLPLNKLAERRARRLATGAEEPEAKAEDVLLLEEIRDLLAAQGGGGATAPRPRP